MLYCISGNSNGLYVIYADYDRNIYLKKSTNNGSSWDSSIIIDQDSNDCYKPEFCCTDQYLLALWNVRNKQFFMSRSDNNGNSWSTPASISGSSTTTHLSSTCSGEFIAVLRSEQDGTLNYKESKDGSISWSLDENTIFEGQNNKFPDIEVMDKDNIYMVWSDNPILFKRTAFPNSIPQIIITSQDIVQEQISDTCAITWEATDVDNDQTLLISLYYDIDQNPDTKSLIDHEIANSGQYKWDVSNISGGDFYIYAFVDDQHGGTDGYYSDYPVIINHTPNLFLYPGTGNIDSCDSQYTIRWSAYDIDLNDTLRLSLFYDIDRDTTQMDSISVNLENTGRYVWNTENISDGEYYLYAKVSDRHSNKSGRYCGGKIIVHHKIPICTLSVDSLLFNDVWVDSISEKTFTISNDGDANLYIYDLYATGDEFSIKDVQSNFTLIPQESRNVGVEFQSSEQKKLVEELVVIKHSAKEYPDYVYLEGNTVLNLAPQIISAPIDTAIEDVLYEYRALAIDSNDQDLDISFIDYPAWLSPGVGGTDGDTTYREISGIPIEGAQDTDFLVIATDGMISNTLIVNLTVLPVNDSPEIVSVVSDTAREDEFYQYRALAFDPDGPELTFSFIDYPAWLSPGVGGTVGDTTYREISGIPTAFIQDTSFKVIVTDGFLSDTLIVLLFINHPLRVTISTSPESLIVFVDNIPQRSDSTYRWFKNEQHELHALSPQSASLLGERWRFDHWSDNGGSLHTVTVISDSQFISYFTKQCSLSVISTHGKPFGTGWYDENHTASFGLSSTDTEGDPGERFSFKQWHGSGTNSYSGEDTIQGVLMSNPIIETAIWDTLYFLLAEINPDTGGMILRIPDRDWYTKGDTVTLIAVICQDSVFRFDGWSGDITSYSDAIQVIMNQSHTIQANFQIMTHELITKIKPDTTYGRIETIPEDIKAFIHKTRITVKAISKPGYKFEHWEGAVSGEDSIVQFTILSDTTITAHFAIEDTIRPYVKDCYPKKNAKMVAINNGLEFKVKDDIYGVDRLTLNVSVLGTSIIQGVEVTTGSSVDINIIDNGYHISYTPSAPFDTSTVVNVEIECYDLADPPNQMQYSYSFKTGKGKVTVTSEGTIPPTGGIIEDNSGVKLRIPNNALDDTTIITIGHIENPPSLPDTIKGIGLTYHFGPVGIEFSFPVIIKIPFSPNDLKAAGILTFDQIKLFYFSTYTGNWEELHIVEIDSVSYIVHAEVSHFSYYTLAIWNAHSESGKKIDGFASVYNYPNPFNPDQTSTFIVYELSKDAIINMKIYDVSGELVVIIEEKISRSKYQRYRVEWNGRNDNGELVANNVYFCVIESRKGDRAIRKIALIR